MSRENFRELPCVAVMLCLGTKAWARSALQCRFNLFLFGLTGMLLETIQRREGFSNRVRGRHQQTHTIPVPVNTVTVQYGSAAP